MKKTFFQKINTAFSAFAKSKWALPVLGGSLAVVVVAGVAVYHLTENDAITQNELDATSDSTIITTGDSNQDDENYTSTSIDLEVYADTVLHESEDAGQDYIDNTLFLGDSNTYRYMSYGFADLTNAIGVVGMGVSGIETLECVKFKTYSGYVTIPEALPIMQPQRVVFSYGTNNLGGNVDSFIETYTEGIQACYDAYPYFDIIVNAIPPVDVNRSYTNVTMQQIDEFNAALVVMCEENGWKFLNSSEALKDPDTGFAVTEYTVSDGLHLSLDGCTALFEYIRTHAYETEDIRPKPLDEILERDETPPDLITEDPLKTTGSSTSSTTQTSTVSVYFAASSGGVVSGDTDQTIAIGSSSSAVTAVPSSGYYFAGWSSTYSGLSSSSDATITYTPPSDVNAFGGIIVTAYFAQEDPEIYTVTFSLSGETSGASLSATSLSVTEGDSASVTLTLQDGYTASVSEGTYSGSTIKVSNVSSNKTVIITISASATAEPSATATAEPSATTEPSATASATATATATTTVAPTATATQEVVATATATTEITVDPTVEPAATAESTPTPESTPTE